MDRQDDLQECIIRHVAGATGHHEILTSAQGPDAVASFWRTAVTDEAREEITFPAQLGSIPCVHDVDGRHVPLFHVFAVIEENTDFAAVCEELPDVAPETVDTVFEFMYRALQMNSVNIDIDSLIDRWGHDYALFKAIEQEVADRRAEAPQVASIRVDAVRMEVDFYRIFPGHTGRAQREFLTSTDVRGTKWAVCSMC